jgi:hypothetical protein
MICATSRDSCSYVAYRSGVANAWLSGVASCVSAASNATANTAATPIWTRGSARRGLRTISIGCSSCSIGAARSSDVKVRTSSSNVAQSAHRERCAAIIRVSSCESSPSRPRETWARTRSQTRERWTTLMCLVTTGCEES